MYKVPYLGSDNTVTSLAEVWSEMLDDATKESDGGVSRPLRKCGLKYFLFPATGKKRRVTSLAEVWIEILDWRAVIRGN